MQDLSGRKERPASSSDEEDAYGDKHDRNKNMKHRFTENEANYAMGGKISSGKRIKKDDSIQ